MVELQQEEQKGVVIAGVAIGASILGWIVWRKRKPPGPPSKFIPGDMVTGPTFIGCGQVVKLVWDEEDMHWNYHILVPAGGTTGSEEAIHINAEGAMEFCSHA